MNVALIGYGKMGKTLEKLLKEKEHHVVGIIDLENSNRIEENLEKADVAIEFSTPNTAYENIVTCIRNNVPVVSGTTGWLDQFDEVKELVAKHKGAFFYSSNYSIGVNIFFELNRYLAQLMNQFPQYDVLMEEVHHTEKKDSPSGTAITIAEGIINNVERKNNWVENSFPNLDTLPIYAKRIGKIFGDHEVQYHNKIDTIKISHKAYGREGFAHGAISASEWLLDKKGVFGMNDILGLSEK